MSTKLLQRPTGSEHGPYDTVARWVDAIDEYLKANGLSWSQVGGVGLAIPGPYQRYGVFDHSPNLPDTFVGFDVHTTYMQALAERAGMAIPLIVGNDGNMGGVAEAQRARGNSTGTVVMLAPGSGLGCAYIDRNGLPLEGDTISGMEAAHMPAPLHLLDAQPYPCGCGRTWGCVEVYTTLAGLPYLLADALKRYPDHELARSSGDAKHPFDGTAGTRAEQRSAGTGDLRLPGAGARTPRRLSGDGPGSHIFRDWRGLDGSGIHVRRVPHALP